MLESASSVVMVQPSPLYSVLPVAAGLGFSAASSFPAPREKAAAGSNSRTLRLVISIALTRSPRSRSGLKQNARAKLYLTLTVCGRCAQAERRRQQIPIRNSKGRVVED